MVIVSASLQHRPDQVLALSIGTCLLNNTLLLGLSLLFLPRRSLRSFAPSSINYALLSSIFCIPISILLAVTFDVYPPLFKSRWSRYLKSVSRISGIILLLSFGLYLALAALALWKGHLQHPDDSDSDSDDASSASSSSDQSEREGGARRGATGAAAETHSTHSEVSATSFVPAGLLEQASGLQANLTTPLISRLRSQSRTKLSHHLTILLTSLLLLLFAGASLPHSTARLAQELHIGDTRLVLTLLCALLVLPPKLWALLNSSAANLDGLLVEISSKNIFFLTLGVGLSFITGAAYPTPQAHIEHLPLDNVSGSTFTTTATKLVFTPSVPVWQDEPIKAQDLLLLSLSSLLLLLLSSLNAHPLLLLVRSTSHRLLGFVFLLLWIVWAVPTFFVWS